MKKPLIIRLMEYIKTRFNIQTYILEYVFVAIILIAVALFSGKGGIEWVGVLAVFLTFGHASIAERLREREELKHIQKDSIEVHCYYKLPYYFYAKEACWLIYFVWLGAYSALAGVGLFLIYTPWRKYYRKWHPIK